MSRRDWQHVMRLAHKVARGRRGASRSFEPEDLAQAALLKLVRVAELPDGDRELAAYVIRTVDSVIADEQKRGRATKRHADRLASRGASVAELERGYDVEDTGTTGSHALAAQMRAYSRTMCQVSATPEALAIEAELRATLDDEPELAAVVSGLSVAETAERYGVSPSGCEKRIRRSRDRLREVWS